MTLKAVSDMIASIGLPFAYYEFPDGTEQEPPFVVYYYPESDDFYADNKNYVDKRRLYVELYTNEKDFGKEAAVESALSLNGLTYRKVEAYIGSERMYQITYETEVIINE